MKCKSWSNKINNFVVRRLKSIKINGQQQQQQSTTAAAAAVTQQPQYLSAAMPAMPKEKAATAVSLNESNFSELKFKELATSAAVVVAAAAMATTATANAATTNAAATHTNRLQPHHTSHSHYQQQQQFQKQQQSQQQQQRSTCGCGAASAVSSSNNNSSSEVDGYKVPSYWKTNGYASVTTSPLAAAMGEQSATAKSSIASTSPLRNSSSSNTKSRACSCPRARTTAPPPPPTQSSAAVTPPKKSANDFIFGKYIGEGSFSTVYLAVDVHTKREYAIKVCDKRHILRELKQEYVRREREVMHQLTNVPGFVNLSCTFQDNRSLYFVMTYAKNSDLLPYINKVGSFDADCTRHYAAELVLACEQMHCHNIVHRDLKPENILLDEDMHTLIADFGSAKILTEEDRVAAALAPPPIMTASGSNSSSGYGSTTRSRSRTRHQYLMQDDGATTGSNSNSTDGNDDGDDDTNDTGSDDVDSPSRQPRYQRKRRGSFVGTAQYVSPEVLQNGPITASADLWALGCIIYQMVSGLPPFRASTDYVIFKQILACKLDFPEGFDKDAEDLVRKLLKVNPQERLGAQDLDDEYTSIRAHPFFAGVDFDTVRQQTPPPICPYLPGVSKDENFPLAYHALEHLEPGLGDKQLTRLLGMELGTALGIGDCEFNDGREEIEEKTDTKNIFDLTDAEKQKRLEQQKSDKWHVFADNEVILKKGYINKRKGLFARRRMLLLTTGPRLIYIDPVQMIKKGEIPWSPELRVEPKNFKIFFVHTPNRTYYLEDPEGFALQWNDAIEKMRLLKYTEPMAAPAPARTASRTRSAHCSASAAGNGTKAGSTSCTTTATQVKTA